VRRGAVAGLSVGYRPLAVRQGARRELLGAWRDAKKSAWKAAMGWAMRLVMALLLAGLAMRLGFAAWLE